MLKGLTLVFAGAVGAAIVSAGSIDLDGFALAASQSKRIDQDFPGYEDAFYKTYPRGTLDVEDSYPSISGDGYRRSSYSRVYDPVLFHHAVRQEVTGTEQSCVYETVQWRFPFVIVDKETTVECSPL